MRLKKTNFNQFFCTHKMCGNFWTILTRIVLLLQQIKAIADAGCKVVVSGGKVGELALHYCNKYQLMVVRLMSKWDLRRLCKSIGATPLPRIVSIGFVL